MLPFHSINRLGFFLLALATATIFFLFNILQSLNPPPTPPSFSDCPLCTACPAGSLLRVYDDAGTITATCDTIQTACPLVATFPATPPTTPTCLNLVTFTGCNYPLEEFIFENGNTYCGSIMSPNSSPLVYNTLRSITCTNY